MKVLIYSNEHWAWWRDNYCGYTTKQEEAGVFDYEEAHKRYPTIGFNRKDEDYFVRLDETDNTQETKLTPLEALNEVAYSYGYDEYIELISNALKRNIELELANIELEHHLKLAEKELNKNDKKLKALEIIIKKRVNVDSLIYYFEQGVENEQVCHWYNCYQTDYPDEPNRILQIEDVELLKEVLLCQQ